MAIGSIINLGGGGGSISGTDGVFIIDTSTMSVGDTVRVRSMYNVSQTEDKQVATVGTPLYFTVPPYDYYKICMVQDIGGVDTEVGGVYHTVDLGQTYFIDNIFDLHTLGGIQNILNAHNENQVLNIGDEVTIDINLGGVPQSWIMQIAYIDGTNHLVYLVSKYLSASTYSGSGYYPNRTALQNYLTSFYNGMSDKDKRFIKMRTCKYAINGSTAYSISQYVWLPSRQEVVGDISTEDTVLFPIFSTQASRIKTLEGGVAGNWQTRSGVIWDQRADYITTTGGISYSDGQLYALPAFMLQADS